MGINSLDSLATNGIINFDADAFIKGTPPRFAGSPEAPVYLPGEQPLNTFEPSRPHEGGPKLQGEAEKDAFIHKDAENNEGGTSWKKILTIGLLSGLAIFGASKLKKLPKGLQNIGESIKNLFTNKKGGVFKRIKKSVNSFVTGKPAKGSKTKKGPKTPNVGNAKSAKITKTTKTLAEKFSLKGRGPFVKWTALAATALLGLYGAYEVLIPHKKGQTTESPSPTQASEH